MLRRVTGIAITRLTSADVVRHPLVARIVDAYDKTPSLRDDAIEVGVGVGVEVDTDSPSLPARKTSAPSRTVSKNGS